MARLFAKSPGVSVLDGRYVKIISDSESPNYTLQRINNAGGNTIIIDARSLNEGSANWISDGVFGYALRNAASEYISITGYPDFKGIGTGNYTIEFWIRGSDYINMGYFRRYADGGNPFFRIGSDSGGIFMQSSTNFIQFSTAGIDANWHHVALVRTDGYLTFYVDGVAQLLNGGFETAIADSFDWNYDAPIQFMWDGRPFIGDMDEIRVSNIARWSTDFIPPVSEYTTDANTLILLHLNETSGVSVSDSSGNGYNGVVTGIVSGSEETDFSLINSGGNVANHKITGAFKTSIPNGYKPFYTDSQTLNDNFNADMLDGKHLVSLNSYEIKLGSDCSLTDGDINRILTITGTPYKIEVDRQPLYPDGTDYSITGQDVTFLIPIYDSQKIVLWRTD